MSVYSVFVFNYQRMTLVLKDFFSIPILFFKCIGLQPFGHRTGIKHPLIMSIIFWFSVIDLGVVILAEIAYFVRGVSGQGRDFLSVISCVACTLFGLVGWEELLLIWRKRETLKRILNFLDAEFPKLDEQQDHLQMNKVYKESRALMISFSVLFIVLISTFNFAPVVVNVYEFYAEHKQWSSDFPFFVWFPFDPTSPTHLYVAIYIWEVFGGFAAVLSCLATNLFVGAIVTQLCLQLSKIKGELIEAVDLQRKSGSYLKPIVVRHSQIIDYCELLEETLSVSLFYNYILSSMMLCLGLFMVVVGVRLSDLFKFCLFLISCLLQTLTMSHYGQDMIEHVRYLFRFIV